MIKQIIIFIILALALFGGVTLVKGESIGEFELSEDVQIFQTCNNCTYCNFTRVTGLNQGDILSNVVANKNHSYFFYNIDSNNFTKVGEYTYCYDCGNLVESRTGCLDFEMTFTGGDLTLPMAVIYSLSLAFLIFLLFLVVTIIGYLPSGNTTNDAGDILQISNLKHLRPVLWGVSWTLVLAMLFVISNITLAYLPTFMLGDLFWAIWTILFWLTIIGIPLSWIWIFVRIFQDKEMKKLLERGVELNQL